MFVWVTLQPWLSPHVPLANVPGPWARVTVFLSVCLSLFLSLSMFLCSCPCPCHPGPGQRPPPGSAPPASGRGLGGTLWAPSPAAFCQRSLSTAPPLGHSCGPGGAFSLGERRPKSQRVRLAPRRPRSRSCQRPSESFIPMPCPSVPWRLQARRSALHLRCAIGSTPQGQPGGRRACSGQGPRQARG